MSDMANQLNVPSDAPLGVFRSPNKNPQFDTTSADVSYGSTGGEPVSNADVVRGGTGVPIFGR